MPDNPSREHCMSMLAEIQWSATVWYTEQLSTHRSSILHRYRAHSLPKNTDPLNKPEAMDPVIHVVTCENTENSAQALAGGCIQWSTLWIFGSLLMKISPVLSTLWFERMSGGGNKVLRMAVSCVNNKRYHSHDHPISYLTKGLAVAAFNFIDLHQI